MYKLIRRPEEASQYLEKINPNVKLFLDTETMHKEGHTDNSKTKTGGLYGDVRLFQMYQKGWDEAVLFDCKFLDVVDIATHIKEFKQVWHNASYDLHTINLATAKPYVPTYIEDTLYLSRMSLSKLTKRFGFYNCLEVCDLSTPEIKELDKAANQKADWGGYLSDEMLRYAAMDVLKLAELYDVVKDFTGNTSYLLDIFNLKYALEYSRRGIPIDQIKIKDQLLEATETHEQKMKELFPVNPNSPKQVCEFLGTSKSDKNHLMELAIKGDERAQLVMDTRSLSKTVMFLNKFDRPEIKGFYNPYGAVTGRFSCTGGDRYSHTNAQQMPRRILKCLWAGHGKKFVFNDYSNMELKMAVSYIGDTVMNDLLNSGTDLHTHTGCIIYKVKPEDITYFQRMIGKICNFLMIFGGSVFTLQKTIMSFGGVLLPFDECKHMHKAWLEEYHYFKEWHDMVYKTMKVYGYMDVETALGKPVRALTANEALNIPIQGSCAEVNKLALAKLKRNYPDEHLISTIHDSNCLICPEEEDKQWIDALNECMTSAWYYCLKDFEITDVGMSGDSVSDKYWTFSE